MSRRDRPPALVPVNPEPGGWHDEMRAALGRCKFMPGTHAKRFARHIAAMPLGGISDRQWVLALRYAYRFRRQMPDELVPSRAAVEALPAWEPARPKHVRGDPPEGRPARRARRPAEPDAGNRRQTDLIDLLNARS